MDTNSDKPTDDIAIPPADLDTPQTDAAIDDIVAHESDQALNAEDANNEMAEAETQPMDTEPAKHGHPIFWFTILLLALLAILAAYVLTSPELPFSL